MDFTDCGRFLLYTEFSLFVFLLGLQCYTQVFRRHWCFLYNNIIIVLTMKILVLLIEHVKAGFHLIFKMLSRDFDLLLYEIYLLKKLTLFDPFFVEIFAHALFDS